MELLRNCADTCCEGRASDVVKHHLAHGLFLHPFSLLRKPSLCGTLTVKSCDKNKTGAELWKTYLARKVRRLRCSGSGNKYSAHACVQYFRPVIIHFTHPILRSILNPATAKSVLERRLRHFLGCGMFARQHLLARFESAFSSVHDYKF